MPEEPIQPTEFDPKVSPIAKAYELLSATNPFDLQKKYNENEQVYFKSRTWDYNNPELLFNKVKAAIEEVGLENLKGEEEKWAREILWFWYHHAISSARVMYPNNKLAREFAVKALELLNGDEYNQITRLLYYLVHHDVKSAEEFALQIVDPDDQELALELIQEYKDNKEFFLQQ
jgi:hypothetical protein